ncbi:MAG TPA: GAF domain-containing SpoIIE family protein phosphatase [Gemmatimonadaceae bacterium]|nr:GAF domain-containing SpoIIE family protein phosphatase [Gemmatimonadaceae bacterium]
MKELETVLVAFRDITQCDAAVWSTTTGNVEDLTAIARSAPKVPPPDNLPFGYNVQPLRTNSGAMLVAPVPGAKRTWLAVAPCGSAGEPAEKHLQLLLPFVAQILRGASEVDHAAMELAERYEEINLLYTIGDILGRTVTLEDAAATILTEISETVGARHASILVHEPASDVLHVVAAIGSGSEGAPPIPVDDPDCVSARVFRTQHPLTVDEHEMVCEAERPYRRGQMLSVPIMWTTPSGGQPLGVVNLSDRRSHEPYSAGDQKLVAAIATQIGTAIQNARLVRASLEQQRLMQEMYLAHDLQMKLLPNPAIVAPEAKVAARVVPAESVGGDFYHLFRMAGGRTGVMVGDVSGHGYRAALIMALAMSAAAIHAQSAPDPGQMLSQLLATLREELATTEMFISMFFGVIEKKSASLRYSNTGHPHAFIFSPKGKPRRLVAQGPPLGMTDEAPGAAAEPWQKGEDLLVLFTDGIIDARSPTGERLGEAKVLQVIGKYRAEMPDEILKRVFDMLAEFTGGAPSDDDLTLLLLRS